MDKIILKVDLNSKKKLNKKQMFKLVPQGYDLGSAKFFYTGKEEIAGVSFDQFLRAGLIDAHLYIVSKTGYGEYIVSDYPEDNHFITYKITEDDNTTDNNIQNLDGE